MFTIRVIMPDLNIMMKKVVTQFLKVMGYEKRHPQYKNKHSVLNSKEFVLEERVAKNKVVGLIQRLIPFKTNKSLVRLGPNGDGGYLVPDDLKDIEACFSPGVSSISGFELDCSKLGMKLFLADKSVNEVNLNGVDFNFIKKFIGCTNNEDFITIEEWVKENDIDKESDLLLQMDIEGHEYDVLINMSNDLLNRFRIIVIEFHNLHKLWNSSFFRQASTAFDKLLQTHTVVHNHPNNCCGIDSYDGVEIPRVTEFTFLRKDRVKNLEPCTSFPHLLDYDNTDYPHFALPNTWYKKESMN